MGRIAGTCRLQGVLLISGLVLLAVTLYGCSTASWIFHHNGPGDGLVITEADVDAMIDGLLIAQPGDSGDIIYDKTTDRYELASDVYRNAVRDGIIRRVQEKKIGGFLKDYRYKSFTDALIQDAGTAGAAILLLGILGILLF